MNKRIKKKRWKAKVNRQTTKKQREANRRICKRFPFLIPRQVFSDKIVWDIKWRGEKKQKAYSYTLINEFPSGWWKAFGFQLCNELWEDLIKCSYLYKFRFEQIKEKFGCYDSETEVLTLDGWKYFKDLSFQDKIATLNQQNNNLEYQYPTDIIAEKYTGKMYRLENRGVSLCVTPNHKLYVSKGSYFNGQKNNEKRTYDFELVTPDKYFGKDKRFAKGCNWKGEEPQLVFKIKGIEYDALSKKDDPNSRIRHYIDKNREFELLPFLRFLGFYVAEGCSIKKSLRANEICVAYNGLDEEELICNLIEGIGYNSVCGTKDGSKAVKKIYDTTLGEWLYNQCGHLAPNKKVPNFIKKLPPKYIEEFLTYLYIGDGHKAETSNILYTVSKQLSDDVQELLLKCGYAFRTTIRHVAGSDHEINGRKIKHNYDAYEINWLKNTEIEIEMSKAKTTKSFREEWVNYNGSVYCVSVPNHVIYIRRNGKGIWCGNSLRCYTGPLPKESNAWNIIEDYSKLSENICISCGKPDVNITDTGWILPICKDCFYKQEKRNNKYYKKKLTDEEIYELYEKSIVKDDDGRMADVRRIRQWDCDGTIKDIEYNLKEKAAKIRARWRKNHHGKT